MVLTTKHHDGYTLWHLRSDQSHSERDLVGELTQAVRRDGMKMGFYYSGLYDWSFGSGGLINNRWRPFKFHDFITREYAKLEIISEQKWEEFRGLGKSFGINRIEGAEETISADALVALLVDIVSMNGNLLLDVGPEPDGKIPAIQLDRLQKLGAWLKQNGEAIYDTKPWVRAAGKTHDSIDIRFTTKGKTLYAILLSKPKGSSVTLVDVPVHVHGRATLLGAKGDLPVRA